MAKHRTLPFLVPLFATAMATLAWGSGLVAATEPSNSFNPANLVRFDDRLFVVRTDDTVSTERLAETTVRKIGYGRTTYVDVVTTPTGTYSSDGLASPHIRYPGIETTEVTDIVAVLGQLGSIVQLAGRVGTSLAASRSTCVLGATYVICN